MRATNKYAVDNLKRKKRERRWPLTNVFQLFLSYGILFYVLELCTFVNYARALLVPFTPRFRAILGSFCPLYGACYGVLARNALHFHLCLTSLQFSHGSYVHCNRLSRLLRRPNLCKKWVFFLLFSNKPGHRSRVQKSGITKSPLRKTLLLVAPFPGSSLWQISNCDCFDITLFCLA